MIRAARPLLAVTLAAAATAGPGAWADDAMSALAGPRWLLETIGGAPLPASARDPVLRFEATDGGLRFTASAGCNRLMGAARAEGGNLTLGPVAATRMACPPPLASAEAALLAGLAATARWEVAGDRLRLLDAEDAAVLEARADPG